VDRRASVMARLGPQAMSASAPLLGAKRRDNDVFPCLRYVIITNERSLPPPIAAPHLVEVDSKLGPR
jgi:hypothetical protein